ncbi:hematopoietic death receptor isoform X1 [Scophthalmus maximus]|uniref:hematopoietic death receptor isoform X1 n=1 Tax=Scophthalmus maximus TaxID=52904 RepID=UPI000F34EBB2|nr:hematopoietic death receptor isoform X1 [Scophthalmus maximus]
MTNFFLVVPFLILPYVPTGASAFHLGGSRTRRDDNCRYDLEYRHGNLCCVNCPAGTHLKSHCTRSGEKGKCQECDYGTYTEHGNELNQCFKCTQCRPDQEIVRPCTPTQDTQCQCRRGRFCVPDQACEVCKKCLRCEQGQEVVRNCTSTSDSECKKIQLSPGSSSANAAVIVPLVLILLLAAVIIVGGFFWWKKRRRTTDPEGDLHEGTKAGQHLTNNSPTEERAIGDTRRPSSSHWPLVRARPPAGTEDERRVLCESLSSSASNSQHSLTGPPPASLTNRPNACPAAPWQPDRRTEEPFPKLVPLKGEESLRKCFEYFEEIEFNYQKRFFRHLGINDNVIKSKDPLPYEDRIHELLNIWVEREGRDAALDDLLKALLDLNQRRTAETVKEKAIHNGHYRVCESL